VRKLSEDFAGTDVVLRGGSAADGLAGYATYDPTSARARRGDFPGAAGGNPDHGQHVADAHARDHAAAGVGCRASGQRSPGTAAADFAGRSSETEMRDACLGPGASALGPEARQARLEKSVAAYKAGYGAGGSSRRITMKAYGKFTVGLLVAWFAFALIGGAMGLFSNQSNRIGAAVGIAAGVPIVVFVVWFAASDSFRKFAYSLNPQTLTLVQFWRIIGITFVILQARSVLPAIFALPAGYGDIFIGATATYSSGRLRRSPRGSCAIRSVAGVSFFGSYWESRTW